MLKVDDVIRIAQDTHRIVRTHHPVTELHPVPRPLTFPAAGCGRSVDGRDLIPWALPAPGAEVTCTDCVGAGPAVQVLIPDAALDVPYTVPAVGWTAGRKGKGKRMHGIPDVSVWSTVEVTSGRGKNKSTRHVVQWEAACGDVVGGWDGEVTVPDQGKRPPRGPGHARGRRHGDPVRAARHGRGGGRDPVVRELRGGVQGPARDRGAQGRAVEQDP
jgi:hypothetical protein